MVTGEDRTWEDAYRNRWAHDKIVRSTHGVNCTGSCSWKIYVKGGIVTWETQQTDYPRTRWDMPNHEPRGCARGASYSWYLYSANRVKYPMVRGRLLKSWRAARLAYHPVEAWASIVESDAKRRDYQSVRGLGGFVRSSWDEVNEIVAAANVYTIKKHGPTGSSASRRSRPCRWSATPPAAATSRLIGGVCMSFYDWYCDLPPSSPQVWGEQTDVPESADWYNSTFIIAWGSNVPQTRTPDAHFFTEVRYKGAKTVAVTPDYSEVAKLADIWMHPKQGTDAAVAMAMGHVILKEFYFDKRSAYFDDYARRYTDMPMLVMLKEHTTARRRNGDGARPLRARLRLRRRSARPTTPSGKPWRSTSRQGRAAQRRDRLPLGSRRACRRGQVEPRSQGGRRRRRGQAEAVGARRRPIGTETAQVGFPISAASRASTSRTMRKATCWCAPCRYSASRWPAKDGPREALVATVFDLQVANYGVARGLPGEQAASELRRQHALHAGLAGAHHRRAARADHHRRPPVRRQRRQDARQVDGHHRRGDEPLVPQRHELPRRHQHADDVRLHRPERRRLGALRRPGESCVRRPAGRRWPSRSTGFARRGR
jgi:nitrate reductase alpha subunit